jgi:hypothetical protein
LQEVPVVPERQWPGYIPDSGQFTLAEIGRNDLRLDQSNQFKVSLKLRSIPDFAFAAYPARIALRLSVDPAFITRNSQLEVSLNGKPQRRWGLKGNPNGSPVTADIQVPGSMFRAENNLSVAITPIEDRSAAAVLLASSRLQLQHDISVTLPDLGLLRHGLYPLSIRGDLSETVLLMPRNISAAAYSMALAAAAEFGRVAPGPNLFPRLKRLADLSADDKASSHFVYLRSAPGDETAESITNTWPMPTGGIASGQMVQEIISPWNSRRVVLLVDASGHSSPAEFVRSVLGEGRLDRLSGDVVYLNRGELLAYSVSSKKVLATTFYTRRLQAWLGGAWYRVPIVAGLLSLLLYFLSLTGIRYYRRQTHLNP